MHDELYTWEVIIACIHAFKFDSIQIYFFPKTKFLSYTYIPGLQRQKYIRSIYQVYTMSKLSGVSRLEMSESESEAAAAAARARLTSSRKR